MHRLNLAIALVFCPAFAPAGGQEVRHINPLAEAKAACANLRTVDFAKTEDAPATIVLSEPIRGEDGLPDHCNVEGYVVRNVKFRIVFPLTGWNGKMLVSGQGGQAGSLSTTFVGEPLTPKNHPMMSGYAYVTHDSGHYSGLTEGLWGWNNESAMIDYGFRGGHVANIVGKAILLKFFGHQPTRSYYYSCSNGGREAMMMPQRYPWDYDGVIAGDPTWSYSDAFVHASWLDSHVKGDRKKGHPGIDGSAAQILHEAVIAQCDMIDGTKDGILEDPRLCKVDLTRVTCMSAKSKNCLSPYQAELARKIYEGPKDKEGRQITLPSAMPGSELNWVSTPWLGEYVASVLRYLAFDPAPGPAWEPDPSEIARYRKRMGLMDSLFSANNPDLRTFKRNGGKLIVYFGWNDQFFGTLQTIDYYETVERLMGGQSNTQDFFRLFMIPGMNHCTGGDGAYVFDYLSALDKWVDAGIPPDGLTGYHPNSVGSPEFTRTIRPYHSN